MKKDNMPKSATHISREREPLHIRILNLISAISEIDPVSALNAEEIALLRQLVVRWHGDAAIAVSTIMNDQARTSGVTVYRRLRALEEKGFIHFRKSADDGRVKFIEPTDITIDYIELLRRKLDSAALSAPGR